MMDYELVRKIREYQVRVMLEDNKTYSFANAINDLLSRSV